jgi:hypothetical protein
MPLIQIKEKNNIYTWIEPMKKRSMLKPIETIVKSDGRKEGKKNSFFKLYLF